MSQQVYTLKPRAGKLIVGPQYIYGSKDVITEDHLIDVVEETKTVHFESGPKEVTVLREGDVYWIRVGDTL